LIQDVIGLGGMGSVYRARDMHFPNVVKLVAVKEMINMAPDPLVRQTIVQNFEREANILVTLSHPSIPKIFDYFTHDTRSYLVIEYVNGKDLEAILNETQGFFPQDQVIQWGIELCDVLSYLHNHKPEPIVFRDMKPSNVMVNQQGHIVLVDFGIAKMFRSGQKGTMIGTEGYSPPEQYRGDADTKADIYSLGATMHHLLTRRDPRLEPPFTFSERPVRKINPDVSPELEAVINTALQYNAADRFPSSDAMKDALFMVARKTGSLNRISLRTGPTAPEQTIKPLWTFQCEDEIRGSPLHEKGVVYIGSYDTNLYAVNATDGKFIWKFPTNGGIVGQPIIDDGTIYIGSEDRKLYAIARQRVNTSGHIQPKGRFAHLPGQQMEWWLSVRMMVICMPSIRSPINGCGSWMPARPFAQHRVLRKSISTLGVKAARCCAAISAVSFAGIFGPNERSLHHRWYRRALFIFLHWTEMYML
jgi:eukaryotic-like serine/threonine-protein kinase